MLQDGFTLSLLTRPHMNSLFKYYISSYGPVMLQFFIILVTSI